MKQLILTAPAKLNLNLTVRGKRDDGFHEIDTLMAKLPELADTLTFTEAPEFAFSCDDPRIPADDENLVFKATKCYESVISESCKFSIHLQKKIPHGAGLGGGSSDAATTLLGLNQLHDDRLSMVQLHDIAASLGSDIPFFLSPGSARCTGRGEIIKPLPRLRVFPVLLLKPNFNVPTADAYSRLKQPFGKIPNVTYASQMFNKTRFINDLELPVFQKYRFLAEIKQWLYARKETAAVLMSGSGSTIFAVLKDLVDAPLLVADAEKELDPTLWSWFGETAGPLDVG
jgi:4-diphosphocytidyl-2-C-methyl-D-erythritol kinase